MISDVTKTPDTASSTTQEVKFEKPEERATLDREDFMKLFVTQLQYQDPMKPMDSAEMASQMAQFNMVDLMYENNEAMGRLVSSDESRTRLQAVSFLGHEVRYDGTSLVIGEDGMKPFDIVVDKPCASCKITIRDENGQVVKTWDAGEMLPGIHAIPWDGTDINGDPVSEGIYSVQIEAADADGQKVEISTRTTGEVAGITYPEEGLPLLRIQNGPEIGIDEIWMVEN